jgi:hypothetical protein
VNRRTSIALHRAGCTDDMCPWCQNRAEERKADRDEPMSRGEQERMDDWAERQYWGDAS